ncbi:hypothetical protein RhiirB3_451553 [Rhizophagus irregularis]|nr:hypothetical protein RhiirB3_451553 [Rhizophagus irregularis]
MSYDNEKKDDKCKRCGKYSSNYLRWGWCKSCQKNDLKKNFTNWTSGNEKIDNLIQGKQLGINNCHNNIIEWISYDQFDDIKELGKDGFSTIYSAIWKDGPLQYDENECEYSRKQSIKVNLKLYNSQNIINEFLNEVKRNHLYGISQDPDTKILYYIISGWILFGNEKIDSLIQRKQLEINNCHDFIIEWISYDKFDDIKELEKDEFSTIYSAIWKDGPLQYDENECEYSRKQSTKVNLKLYSNSQNITNEFLNEV